MKLAFPFLHSKQFCVYHDSIGMVNGIEYSGYVAVPYNDETLLSENDTWHPKIDDVVYNAMDWDCPGYNQVKNNKYRCIDATQGFLTRASFSVQINLCFVYLLS